MFFNHIKLALRMMRKQRGYAFINIAGLALGMTVCVLILLWVLDELSYDRFNTHAERIHRVCVDLEAGSHMVLALSMPALSDVLLEECPEVENVARISLPRRVPVKHEDAEFQEDLVCFADSRLFGVFTFPFIAGDPETALDAPYSVVLTEETAAKYFGEKNPIGRTVRIGGTADYAVTGVVKNIPSNSHFRFAMARSFATLYAENRRDMENWLNIQYYTYVLLAENAKPADLEEKFPGIIDKYMGQSLKSIGGALELFLQPLTRIHLFSRIRGDIAHQGDIVYLYLFSGISFFVLILACINFINLATARSAARAQEIGMRKTLGSSRKTIVMQFLGESLVYSLTAFILAAAAISTILPLFESFLGKELSVGLFTSPVLALGFLGLAVLVGVSAGSYPAFYLSSFRPAHVLRTGFLTGKSKSRARNVLVVFQFTVSIFLIIATITVYRQIHFMKTKNLGFDKEQVLVIPDVQPLLGRMSFDTVRDELMKLPGVLNAAGSALVPTTGVQNAIFYPEGFTREQPQKLTRLDIEPHYIPTMKMEIIAGRNFSPELMTDRSGSLLINEEVAELFGWTEPLGKTFTFWAAPGADGDVVIKRVIGVVKNFHFTSLHSRIEPVVIAYDPDRIRYLSLKIESENVSRTISLLKENWKRMEPSKPFDYFLLDDVMDRQYRTELRVGKLSLYFTLLAVVIGCLGLFGLAAYVAEKRTKEIGIRKVLGASAARIVRLISKDFLGLVLIANIFAWPAAYFGLSRWLQNFPYRTHVGWTAMAAAGFLALITALVTVSYQAVKAATANPVESLRSE